MLSRTPIYPKIHTYIREALYWWQGWRKVFWVPGATLNIDFKILRAVSRTIFVKPEPEQTDYNIFWIWTNKRNQFEVGVVKFRQSREQDPVTEAGIGSVAAVV